MLTWSQTYLSIIDLVVSHCESYQQIAITKSLTQNTVLSSADTSIKMTVLPLTNAVYPCSEHCECALTPQIFNYLQFLDRLGLKMGKKLIGTQMKDSCFQRDSIRKDV